MSSVSAGSQFNGRNHRIVSNRMKEANKNNLAGQKYLLIVNPEVVG